MDIDKIKEWISDYNPDALLADGFEDAIIGVGGQYGSDPVVIYDRDECIKILKEQFELDANCENAYVDAIEYFTCNTECAYVGKNTPIFMQKITKENEYKKKEKNPKKRNFSSLNRSQMLDLD